jgi:hypothetical protein
MRGKTEDSERFVPQARISQRTGRAIPSCRPEKARGSPSVCWRALGAALSGRAPRRCCVQDGRHLLAAALVVNGDNGHRVVMSVSYSDGLPRRAGAVGGVDSEREDKGNGGPPTADNKGKAKLQLHPTSVRRQYRRCVAVKQLPQGAASRSCTAQPPHHVGTGRPGDGIRKAHGPKVVALRPGRPSPPLSPAPRPCSHRGPTLLRRTSPSRSTISSSWGTRQSRAASSAAARRRGARRLPRTWRRSRARSG